jgi:hypothetical protein
MEGNYHGYFEILHESLKNRNFNTLAIEIDSKSRCILFVKYEISKGVTLKGNFDLGESINIDKDPKVFRKINQKFIFNYQFIFENKFNEKNDKIKELNEKIGILNNEIRQNKRAEVSAVGTGLNIAANLTKEASKRKANTDLINPNRKKVKGKGAKFDSTNV